MITKDLHIKILKGKQAIGVELQLQSEDNITASVVSLKKELDVVVIKNKCAHLHSFKELFEIIGKDIPIYLSIVGKGIVFKSFNKEGKEDQNILTIATQLFPNFSPNEFVVQEVSVDEKKSLISIVRKELVNNILSYFEQNELYVFNIVFGPFSINLINSYFSEYESITLNEQKIELKHGSVSSVSKGEKCKEDTFYNIDKESVENELVIAYSTALLHFMPNNTIGRLSIDLVNNRDEYLYKRAIKMVGYSFLIVLLTLLLINFFIFSKYNTKLSEYSLAHQQYLSKDAELNYQILDFEKKFLFFKEKGILEGSRTAFYADCIAKILPQSIVLNQVQIHPLERNINPLKEIIFNSELIRINGETNSTKDLTVWISKLKDMNWINELNLTNLQQDENENTTKFQVEIFIN